MCCCWCVCTHELRVLQILWHDLSHWYCNWQDVSIYNQAYSLRNLPLQSGSGFLSGPRHFHQLSDGPSEIVFCWHENKSYFPCVSPQAQTWLSWANQITGFKEKCKSQKSYVFHLTVFSAGTCWPVRQHVVTVFQAGLQHQTSLAMGESEIAGR